LNGGAITEGSVDSTVQINLNIEPQGVKEFYYWICAGKSLQEVSELNTHIKKQTPERFLKSED